MTKTCCPFELKKLAAEIQDAHKAATAGDASMIQHARECGELLITAKRMIPHGQWSPWVKRCGLSARLAQMYIQIVRKWPRIEELMRNGVSLLSLRDALAAVQKHGPHERLVPCVHWNALNNDERREVRRITSEMIELPYESRTFTPCPDRSGNDIVAGCGGAPVYYDIVGGSPDAGPALKYTRGEVCTKLTAFVDGGPRSVVSDLAVDVAQRRINGDRSLSPPSLPPDNTATVTLSPHTLGQCAHLEQVFGTITLEETVAKAVDLAYFSYQIDEVVDEERAS